MAIKVLFTYLHFVLQENQTLTEADKRFFLKVSKNIFGSFKTLRIL